MDVGIFSIEALAGIGASGGTAIGGNVSSNSECTGRGAVVGRTDTGDGSGAIASILLRAIGGSGVSVNSGGATESDHLISGFIGNPDRIIATGLRIVLRATVEVFGVGRVTTVAAGGCDAMDGSSPTEVRGAVGRACGITTEV